MAVNPADVRAIVERACARPEVLDACARRDLGAVISAFGADGLSQGRISALTCAAVSSAGAGLSYPDMAAQAARNASQLWRADLSDAAALQTGRTDPRETGRADPRAWNDASLRWLVDPGRVPDGQPASGVRIGMSDVERFFAT